MMRNIVETVLGGVVLLVAIVFVFFAWRTADVQAVTGYDVEARFLKVGGLEPGADVRISGVKVGTVASRELDLMSFEAIVKMSIRSDVSLPVDTVAVVASDGLLGGKYLRLIPGGAEEAIAPDGMLTNTRDHRSLEDSVSEIIFLATGSGGN